MRNSKISC